MRIHGNLLSYVCLTLDNQVYQYTSILNINGLSYIQYLHGISFQFISILLIYWVENNAQSNLVHIIKLQMTATMKCTGVLY